MVYQQFCVSIAAGKNAIQFPLVRCSQRRGRCRRYLPTVPTQPKLPTLHTDVTYRRHGRYLPTLPTNVTYVALFWKPGITLRQIMHFAYKHKTSCREVTCRMWGKLFQDALTGFIRHTDEMLTGERFAVRVFGMTWQPSVHVRTQQMHQYLLTQ